MVSDIEDLASDFKSGVYDDPVSDADQVQLLDADVDLAWVSIGGSKSMGADFDGAAAEVYRSNMSKTDPETGKMGRDANGKILKHPRYSPPDLTPFIAANRTK
jgi:predicted HAD superfamily Cof-like phosphohydrolase